MVERRLNGGSFSTGFSLVSKFSNNGSEATAGISGRTFGGGGGGGTFAAPFFGGGGGILFPFDASLEVLVC